MKTIGLKIKELRESKKMSQAELAQFLEVRPTTISNYENDVSKPNLSKLVILSNLFGVSLNDLTAIEENKLTNLVECSECRSKDLLIEQLQKRIEELKEFNEYLKLEKSVPLNKSTV